MKKENKTIRIAYGGGRDISMEILKFILKQGIRPLALMLEDKKLNPYDKKLISLCNYLDDSHILKGNQFYSEKGLKLLRNLDLDYIICVRFPLIVPKECLDIPKQGVVNSHPAYLPYNRGWHTPSWAILKDTPYGASLHFMNEDIDAGDIIHQKKIKILATDTAHSLYQRTLRLEVENFKQAWPDLVSKTYKRIPQNSNQASYHKKKDFQSIQFIDLNKKIEAGNLIKHLRALTTSNHQEAAYFEKEGKLYRLQIHITEDNGKKNIKQTFNK